MSEKLSLLLALSALCVVTPARAAEPPKKTPQLLEKGKASFNVNCATCHGPKGEGNGVAAAALKPKPRNFATEEFKHGSKAPEVFDTLAKGLPGTAMIAYRHLSEEERWALAYYVVDLHESAKNH